LFDEAEVLLAARDGADRDSVWLNLRGVLYEAQGDWRRAKRHFSKAVRRDRNCAAAWQNLRRLYELYTFGHTTETIALGDERPALGGLLRQKQDAADD
jgi:tetratricopeptide (TPR) repeat protein